MRDEDKATRLNARTVERYATLLNEHGSSLYGDEWWPGNSAPWMDDGERLDAFCEHGADVPLDEREAARIVDMFERYGRSKFGSGRFGPEFDLMDARSTIGARKARRLHAISDRAQELLKAA